MPGVKVSSLIYSICFHTAFCGAGITAEGFFVFAFLILLIVYLP